jgi:hypothetical protein
MCSDACPRLLNSSVGSHPSRYLQQISYHLDSVCGSIHCLGAVVNPTFSALGPSQSCDTRQRASSNYEVTAQPNN